MSAYSEPAPFFLGTYTRPEKVSGILSSSLDLESGTLTQPVAIAPVNNPTFLDVSGDGKFLYAAGEMKDGSVAAFKIIDPQTLEFLNSQPAGGAGTCHVLVAAGHLFVSNYGGGSIACFPIDADGQIGSATASIVFEGSGPDASRQKRPHAHGIAVTPDGRFAYACDLGTDNVWSFGFDQASGTLVPTDPPSGKCPPGGGPRHAVVHPTLPVVYVNNEMGMSVSVFKRDVENGTLELLETVPSLPEGVSHEGCTSAGLILHPNHRFLYLSNRGHNSITVYEVLPDGLLRVVETVDCGVKMPRGFGIHSGGGWLVVGGQEDGGLASLRIDPATGRLTPAHRIDTGAVPVCVTFAAPAR